MLDAFIDKFLFPIVLDGNAYKAWHVEIMFLCIPTLEHGNCEI